jgi:hypothetical protein
MKKGRNGSFVACSIAATRHDSLRRFLVSLEPDSGVRLNRRATVSRSSVRTAQPSGRRCCAAADEIQRPNVLVAASAASTTLTSSR